jgi:hypothetical protein
LNLFDSLTVEVMSGVPAATAFQAAAEGRLTLRDDAGLDARLEVYTLDWMPLGVDYGPEQTANVQQGHSYVLIVSGAVPHTASVTLEQPLAEGEFTNFLEPVDVNADGSISPIDALYVINALNRGETKHANRGPFTYLDVNSDGLLSPIDALLVINHLNRHAHTMASVPLEASNRPVLAAAWPALPLPIPKVIASSDPDRVNESILAGDMLIGPLALLPVATHSGGWWREQFPERARDMLFAGYDGEEQNWMEIDHPLMNDELSV